jgi:hypothetical protein
MTNLKQQIAEYLCKEIIGDELKNLDFDHKDWYEEMTEKILSLLSEYLPKDENKAHECNTQYCLGFDTGFNQCNQEVRKALGIEG